MITGDTGNPRENTSSFARNIPQVICRQPLTHTGKHGFAAIDTQCNTNKSSMVYGQMVPIRTTTTWPDGGLTLPEVAAQLAEIGSRRADYPKGVGGSNEFISLRALWPGCSLIAGSNQSNKRISHTCVETRYFFMNREIDPNKWCCFFR